MQVYFLWAASVMSIITFAVHTFIGSPVVAGPLLKNTDLPKASKWLNYYTWHVTTIFTFTMGGAYAYAALNPDRLELVVFLTVVTAALSVLSAAVALKGNINPFRFPSTSLFATVSLLGLVGILVE
ncbi:MAG: hypothetical protein BMS9Abin25_0244 [Gammaproteobacteria bacterium]|nr:MAG: hypothetical protein BMS9Abin25_0244 [Gammaproteobacteria bacterium]